MLPITMLGRLVVLVDWEGARDLLAWYLLILDHMDHQAED